MTTESLNRYRISRKPTILKIVIYIILFTLTYNVIVKLNTNTLTAMSIVGFIAAFLIFCFFIYFLNTIKTIEYDDIKQIIYVVTSSGSLVHEVPVENIDQILLTSIGFDRLGYQYRIIFRDSLGIKQEIRFFTIPFRKDINTIIIDTRIKNPNLVTRNWNIG